MQTLHRAFLICCLWQMRFEHTVGSSTGMNPRYLHTLSQDITNLEGELQRAGLAV